MADLFEKKIISATYLKILIMDECDEMLQKNHQDNVSKILKEIPSDCQLGLFTATFQKWTYNFCTQFTKNPALILVDRQELMPKGISQYYELCKQDAWKLDYAIQFHLAMQNEQMIIFCNSKETVAKVADEFVKNMISVSTSLVTTETKDELAKFKTGETKVLISTDAYSRGIDIQQVSLVINYDVPSLWETYVHRIGRAGRFGRKGVAINLVTESSQKFLKEIEENYKVQIKELPIDLGLLMN